MRFLFMAENLDQSDRYEGSEATGDGEAANATKAPGVAPKFFLKDLSPKSIAGVLAQLSDGKDTVQPETVVEVDSEEGQCPYPLVPRSTRSQRRKEGGTRKPDRTPSSLLQKESKESKSGGFAVQHDPGFQRVQEAYKDLTAKTNFLALDKVFLDLMGNEESQKDATEVINDVFGIAVETHMEAINEALRKAVEETEQHEEPDIAESMDDKVPTERNPQKKGKAA